MTPQEFTDRLRGLATAKGLNAGDLGAWFKQPRPTVRTWLFGNNLPLEGSKLDECVRRLKLLETCEGFPIPFDVTKYNRREYIIRCFRNADNPRVSKRHPAANG